jgi:hypothetical protein
MLAICSCDDGFSHGLNILGPSKRRKFSEQYRNSTPRQKNTIFFVFFVFDTKPFPFTEK